MAEHLKREALEVRYLLGELSEQEVEDFEKHYLAADPAFEELQIAESEVIDAYVRGELEDEARNHLEQRLAKSSRLQERVVFARTFPNSLSDGIRESAVESLPGPALKSQSSWWKKLLSDFTQIKPAFAGAMAVAMVLIVVGGAALVWQWRVVRTQSEQIAAERAEMARQREDLLRIAASERDKIASGQKDLQLQSERIDELVKQIEGLQKSATPKEASVVATFFLMPAGLRSEGQSRELRIRPGASAVELQLLLPSVDYQRYRVVVTGPGEKLIKKRDLRPGRKALNIQIPVSSLPPGEYNVHVSGITTAGEAESDSDYPFHVPVRP